MSDQQGGPSRGAFGPGHTVLAQPSFSDEVPSAGAVPPATVRDPGLELPAGYAAPNARPVGIPPPPPPARGRARGRRTGPSLAAIGVVSFFVIGGGVTAIALLRQPCSGDDKPSPTVDVPAPTTVAQDPSPAGSASPTATDPPSAPTTPPYRSRPNGRPRPKPGTNPRYPGPRRPPPPQR